MWEKLSVLRVEKEYRIIDKNIQKEHNNFMKFKVTIIKFDNLCIRSIVDRERILAQIDKSDTWCLS